MMKSNSIFILALSLLALPSCPAVASGNETYSLVRLGIAADLLNGLVKEGAYLCTENAFACLGPRRSELATEALRLDTSAEGARTLAEALAFTLDGGLASDVSCALIQKGAQATTALQHLDVQKAIKQCLMSGSEIAKGRTKVFTPEVVRQLCRDETTVEKERQRHLRLIRQKERCEE